MTIQQMLLAGGVVTGSLLLDLLPSAGFAFSVRRIRSNYFGYCMKVRRSSDNAEMDVAFVSDALDTTTLLSWAGANSVYVKTWYDQSGNGLDVNQTTNGSQPRIVNAGSLDTQNSLPSLVFDGTDDGLHSAFNSTVLASRTFTNAIVEKSARTSVNGEGMLTIARSALQDYRGGYIFERRQTNLSNNLGRGGSSLPGRGAIGRQTADSNISALSMVHYTITPASSTESLYIDKVSKTINTAYTDENGSVSGFVDSGSGNWRAIVGARSSGTANVLDSFFQGSISEIATWPTDQSANRSTIETSQSGYFGTP